MRRTWRRPVRSGAALLAGSVALLLAAPAALAQQTEPEPVPAEWSGSAFAEPFDEFLHELRSDRIDTVAGRFRYRKPSASSEIVSVTVDVVDDASDDFEPAPACALEEPVVVPSDGTGAGDDVDELAFEVEGLEVPCNGRYLLEARADTNVDDATFTLRAALVVEVLPPAVPDVAVSADATRQQVRVDWQPVPPADLPPDAYGYLVERAGPQAEDGSWGIFDDLVVVGTDAPPRLVDDVPQPGAYRYRVRTVRRGLDGPVLSSILDGEARTVTVDAPPPTTSTTAAPTTTRAPRVGAAIPRPHPTRRLSPPTTADTGFEQELDYGELPVRSTTTAASPELAAEDPGVGSAVINDEDEGVDVNLIVPAAGALVLLGWAGHIAYLNRLAKQL